MPQIKPLRQYNENEVINFFAYSGTATKGTFVYPSSGWLTTQFHGNASAAGATYPGTLSPRWTVPSIVRTAVSGETPIGMLLHDIAETDENGEKLLYDRQKQDEKMVTISGQAVPILVRGIVLYSGIIGSPTAGSLVYLGAGGVPTTATGSALIGQCLGPKDPEGFALLNLKM